MKMIVLLSALAGCASVVFAQGSFPALPLESEIRLEVWNGSSWGNTVNASPGQQVEYRVVISYTGPRTDLLGLGDSRYQVSFSNADNTGPSRDTLVAFPGDGTSTFQQNMLTQANGASGSALPAYGRTGFDFFGQIEANRNRLRNFRHGGDSPGAGAPAGSWLRVAGEYVTIWPAAQLPTVPSEYEGNAVLRGVTSTQRAPVDVFGNPNTRFVGGVENLVVFRHAVTLSSSTDAREMTVSIVDGSLLRFNTGSSTDDRRYIQWHENSVGVLGTYRTSVAIVPATIVIPTPGVLAVVGMSGLLAVRRRR
jgi:hypothetical protein